MLTVAVLHNYLTCTGGVLLVRANVISSRSFIRLAMFKLELEWTVGVDGAGKGQKDTCTKRLLKCSNVPLTSWDFTNYFQHFLFDSTVLCWIKLKVPFKHWLIKNKSTFDVDALMTFTVITRPSSFFFYFDIHTHIYIYIISIFRGKWEWAMNRQPSKWVRLKTESTIFRQK